MRGDFRTEEIVKPAARRCWYAMTSDCEIPEKTACPSESELIAFQCGNLSLRALEAIGAHLADCTQCLSTIGGAAEEEESVLRNLRRSLREPAGNPFAADVEYGRMADRANQLFTLERSKQTRPSGTPPAE